MTMRCGTAAESRELQVAEQGIPSKVIDALSAVEVAKNRYAVKCGERYVIVTSQQLCGVAFIGVAAWRKRAYECAIADSERYGAVMPAWWTPERRAIFENWSTGKRATQLTGEPPEMYRRITANIETGEEMIAT